ncbi:AraC family transcriptional regulator [Pseudomonas aeruginosa]|uniref:AraC family transcriptional regulator n=1 Tax=Stenotrophomonas maltophilia TaxID=40324 RepID=UPI001094BC34|nr:AraC family transcriptional regulator [Stenotrophomonas maltophilia]MCO3707127.1 AraC family transcriptional regulator [Pseudomonas aeruginosa]HCL2752725.1 AraC family transcriptional regulator [Pseudomonas aeruginosa 449A]TGW15259.1 AraC family transcriptional regulator [Stenotrophomonas maltophilia]HBO2804216.1 AraC family transcriptional regulator [Pseudomonas aeruginosa]HCL2765100.1 AraC family transcriptional regulator [Pseudomonas aeruginosa 449A]
MLDPLAQVVTLLQPGAPFSKRVSGAGRWSVRRSEAGRPYYCAILEGACRLADDGHESIVLQAGDFVLIPSLDNFAMSSLTPVGMEDIVSSPIALPDGEFRVGTAAGSPDVRLLMGYCVFRSPDADLLTSLLPRLVHVRGEKRLATLVQLVGEESRAQRPARDVILERLLEVLLIEALRSTMGTAASPGLLRGLADERLAVAIRRMHESPTEPWTVAQLAKEAALSRSAFYERFRRAVGVAPIEYLLAWRMALAKDLLRRREGGIAEVAERVGYSSANTFTVAFTRHVGLPPARYAREAMAASMPADEADSLAKDVLVA